MRFSSEIHRQYVRDVGRYGPGIRSYEEWNVADRQDEAYGTAIIAENGELVFQEKFSLVKRDSGYYYLAYPRMV
jgi:hypothetical protein